MADVKPFKAIRPKEGLEKQIAALPYDVYNRQEAKKEVELAPLSFLRIDRAETQFPDAVDMYADCVYEKARELLWQMVEEGRLKEDKEDSYYVYELVMEGRSQIGIAACASVDDYLGQVIRKHENTREDKELDRIRHVDACEAQTGPIFLAYRSHPVIGRETAKAMEGQPLYDFTAADGIMHRIFKIDDKERVERIREAFREVEHIYIADGHHRCASAVKVSLKRRKEHPDYTGEEEFNYFLSVLFPDDQLMIMDYNRVVKDLNGHSEEEFLSCLLKDFQVTKAGASPYRPERKGSFGMYLGGSWYRLEAKEDQTVETGMKKAAAQETEGQKAALAGTESGKPAAEGTDPVKTLDVSVLQEKVLAPLLGIQDPRTDARIDFVGGIRGLSELERRVHTDCRVAFALYPTSIAELFAVSDAGLLMPPKSTWFEPKLRSGLLIHRI